MKQSEYSIPSRSMSRFSVSHVELILFTKGDLKIKSSFVSQSDYKTAKSMWQLLQLSLQFSSFHVKAHESDRGFWVMINSESSELKQIVWGNTSKCIFFWRRACSNVQWCLPLPYNKSDAYAMISSPIPPCYFGRSIQRLCNASQSVKWVKTLDYLIHKHFLFKTMTQMPRFQAKTTELQAQP